MPLKDLYDVYSVEAAVRELIPYLEDMGRAAHKAIYFDGWDGLAASAVLRAIAERPPPSLTKKFDRIIHVDCSRWKSRRALQRAIGDELKLPQAVVAAFDRQDEADDFSKVDESSRAEIADVTREIYQTVRNISCLVIFHNGSDNTIDLSDFGFPPFNWFSPYTVLWTFRGRLRLNPEIKEKVDSSQLIIYRPLDWGFDEDTTQLVLEEATEVVNYIQHNKQGINPKIAAKCISYLLWFNKKGGGTINYDWATHASNYWVCDGIVEGDGQFDESWDVSAALHQQIRIEDCSTHEVDFREDQYTEVWKSVVARTTSESEGRTNDTIVSSKLTSFFLAPENGLHISLPPEMFQESNSLRVLKLFGCKFSFYSPPFKYCRNLRFLGLDNCEDQQQEEDDNQRTTTMECFGSLWVLDICHMDWELELSQDVTEQMAANIREVHIKKGRIWHSNLAWRRLRNLHKLRVIEPTCSWETGKKDEFVDMVKLELLDLSGDCTIQVLPSMSSTTSLKALVLDGCVGLEHIGPEGLPPSLESFSLIAGSSLEDASKVSHINLVGCVHLERFLLRGAFPVLEELNLSGTSIRQVDLSDQMVVHSQNFRLRRSFPKLEEVDLSHTAIKVLDLTMVTSLKAIFLVGCEQLRSIIWPEKGMKQLELLCIDTRGGEPVTVRNVSLVSLEQEKYFHAFVSINDMSSLQLLVVPSGDMFCWGWAELYKVNICLSSSTIKDDIRKSNEETVSTGWQIPRSLCTYTDVATDNTLTSDDNNKSSVVELQPLARHLDIGEGIICGAESQSMQGIRAVTFVTDNVQSMHVHDNSSIAAVIPEHMMNAAQDENCWSTLKWCHVERCPNMDTVFVTNYDENYLFGQLETFLAADLLKARSVWSRGRPFGGEDTRSFAKLQAIHLHYCPRLQFVLPLSWMNTLSSLETLHIVCCGDLRQVFPVEAEFLEKIATDMLEFPMLKNVYLHQLSSLRQICEAKMFAPKLETVYLRGCWGLRRLPATENRRQDGSRLVVVDCEKDWWDNLEWDGLHVGHHPSLFAPQHSTYYKKRHLRGTVLR